MNVEFNELVRKAKEGRSDALERLVSAIQDSLYALAVRMLYNPFDAEDATQEILIKIITHLSDYKEQLPFKPWMFRIASNHLLNCKRSAWEKKRVSFEQFESEIVTKDCQGWRERYTEQQRRLYAEEVRISCLQGLLLCLDRPHRIAYILNEIFEMTSKHGACVQEISPAAYRKRASRARLKIKDFMMNNCSLINEKNPCHCEREAAQWIENGELDPDNLVFAKHKCIVKNEEITRHRLDELGEIERLSCLYKYSIHMSSPEKITNRIKRIISTRKFELFRPDNAGPAMH